MALINELREGVRLFDTRLGRERVVHQATQMGNTLKIWFKDPQTGTIEPFRYPLADAEDRFQVLETGSSAFRAEPELVRLVAEGYRLQHAYLFNPIFATETSLIDLLPHQFIAVYRHMLREPRLRFLLADDAGAGKTIMAGLYIREMLLRRLVRRVLIVPPAGLVGNWRRELSNLFRLRFRILTSADAREENPFADGRNDLAIISVDTLWREQMRSHLADAPPYDLVVFDEAHKLSAWRDNDLTMHTSKRYEVAEFIANQGRHLLLLSATPHMGRDDPYYFLWRLLEPMLLSSREAFNRLPPAQKAHHLLRRMKEEMVTQSGAPLYKSRTSEPAYFELTAGEQELYDAVTNYCQTYFNLAKNTNRAAAGLAMSMLQRRLASSSDAILRSLERRRDKLAQELHELEQHRISATSFAAQQEKLMAEDPFEEKTGDEEEAVDGQEENEIAEQQVAGATAARSSADLRLELEQVEHLCELARAVYNAGHESKFEELRQALEAHPNTKALIFTEHRDTMEFLIERLRGMGHEGHIAHIHGGMSFEEREHQVDFFRDPHGARYMVATDAAGEGINLQFCWLLMNYDIPWNPARLEQRMGRVHRYKQTHDVLLINMVARYTREGRVLRVLLDKLEAIRRELGNDKVFDSITDHFKGLSLQKLIERAVLAGAVDEAVAEVETALTADRVRQDMEAERARVECAEVRALLDSIRMDLDAAEMKRMMPAYVRSFFDAACRKLGMGMGGDVTGIFSLAQTHAAVQRVLEANYPASLCGRLTFQRELAMPPTASAPAAVYLHPGEAVFDTVLDLFMARYTSEGERGAVFFDPDMIAPSLFVLAKVPIVQIYWDAGNGLVASGVERREVIAEVLVGVRYFADGHCDEVPAHQLMTLLPGEPEDALLVPDSLLAAAEDLTPVEMFVYNQKALPLLAQLRQEAMARIPEHTRQVTAAFNLREAELAQQYALLKQAVARNEPAARTKLERCTAELSRLEDERAAALVAAQAEAEAIELGTMQIYARAIVLPIEREEAERRRDAEVERRAMEVARHYEASQHGARVDDVSDPKLKRGFDLHSTRPDGSVRFIEVKGRARVGEVELTPNEWAQAANHGDRYWLYVVYHCGTPEPELRVFQNPATQNIAHAKGSVIIDAAAILIRPAEDLHT